MTDKRLMRESLRHRFAWATDDSKFFLAIDETGGWPVGYNYVGFEHTDERKAGFCNSPSNTGWWTVVASADDYFLWKLSPEGLKRITDAAVKHFISGLRADIDPSKVWFRSSSGHTAVVSGVQK